MALIRTEQNSLIGGVSQQPDALRLTNQARAASNCWMSPVDGLTRRMPTLHTGNLTTGSYLGNPAGTNTPFAPGVVPLRYHQVIRDGGEKYQMIFTDTGISGWNMDTGVEVSVALGDDQFKLGGLASYTYLNSFVAPEDLQLLTVADSTFVVNRNETVGLHSGLSSSLTDGFLLFVRSGNYDTDYTVDFTVNNAADTAEFDIKYRARTWDGVTFDATRVSNDLVTPPAVNTTTMSIDTSWILNDIAAGIRAGLETAGPGGPGLVLNVDFFMQFHLGSSTVGFSFTPGILEGITVKSGVGDTAMGLAFETAPRVEGYLPEVAVSGYKIEIVGDAEIEADNYWVEFVPDSAPLGGPAVTTGYWKETIAPGVAFRIDGATAPHRLVNTGLNTFEWEEIPWSNRLSGDDDSNPFPEFVGTTITNTFFYKNRLGFLHSNKASLSETSEFFAFTRSTLLTLLDTAPIEIESAHTRVSLFDHAAPYNEDMILFTELGQFALKGGDILSPRTVQLLPISEFESTSIAPPVATGKTVFFPFRRGATSGVRELFRRNDLTTYDAADTTIQVPNYIAGEITKLIPSTLENCLFALTRAIPPSESPFSQARAPVLEENKLWVYQYLWSGDEKVQGAWHQWDLGADTGQILDLAFFQNTVYVLLKRNNEIMMEKLVLATGLAETDVDWLIHLDGRVDSADYVSETFDGGTGYTTIVLPYNAATHVVTVIDASNGTTLPIISQVTDTVVVNANTPALTTMAGLQYETSYGFTLPLVKEQTPGGAVVAYSNIPQQVRHGHLHFHNSKYFNVDVTIGNRATRTMEFTGINADYEHLALDNIELHDGTQRFAVMGSAKDALVRLYTTTPYPFNITHASWEINYRPRARKFRG